MLGYKLGIGFEVQEAWHIERSLGYSDHGASLREGESTLRAPADGEKAILARRGVRRSSWT
jgi:hypothetical protein